jgi:hypothetical protein
MEHGSQGSDPVARKHETSVKLAECPLKIRGLSLNWAGAQIPRILVAPQRAAQEVTSRGTARSQVRTPWNREQTGKGVTLLPPRLPRRWGIASAIWP